MNAIRPLARTLFLSALLTTCTVAANADHHNGESPADLSRADAALPVDTVDGTASAPGTETVDGTAHARPHATETVDGTALEQRTQPVTTVDGSANQLESARRVFVQPASTGDTAPIETVDGTAVRGDCWRVETVDGTATIIDAPQGSDCQRNANGQD